MPRFPRWMLAGLLLVAGCAQGQAPLGPRSQPGLTAQSVGPILEPATLQIDRILPLWSSNDSIRHLMIYGFYQEPIISAELSRSGVTVAGTGLSVYGGYILNASFDLRGVPAGTWVLTVRNLAKESATASYQIYDPFAVHRLSPGSGYPQQVITLRITGSGFAAPASVELTGGGVGHYPAMNVTVPDSTSIVCSLRTPDLPSAYTLRVTVYRPGGSLTAYLSNAFIVLGPKY